MTIDMQVEQAAAAAMRACQLSWSGQEEAWRPQNMGAD